MAFVNLPQVVPAVWLRSTLRMCLHMGVPVGPDWRTLFPLRGVITYYLAPLRVNCLYVCDSLAFVEERLLRCFEIVTKETLFWASHFKNVLACFHLLSQVTPVGEPLELRLCYREVFDSIVNACKFPRPIGAILKSCWGNQSSLDVTLAILTKNANHVYPSVNWKTYQRRSYSIFRLLSADLAPYKMQASARKLLLLEAAAKMINIPLSSLNKFRRLISMTIDVDVAARLFRGLPAFRSFRRIVKRVSSELPDGRNLLIKFSHLHSAPFDPKASAVHQLTSSFGSISGVSYAEGAFGNPTASAFSTFAYGP
ncbi:MAG: hypothetical protein ACTS46_01520 [Candidatus Hodgkinia cicadicola]